MMITVCSLHTVAHRDHGFAAGVVVVGDGRDEVFGDVVVRPGLRGLLRRGLLRMRRERQPRQYERSRQSLEVHARPPPRLHASKRSGTQQAGPFAEVEVAQFSVIRCFAIAKAHCRRRLVFWR